MVIALSHKADLFAIVKYNSRLVKYNSRRW